MNQRDAIRRQRTGPTSAMIVASTGSVSASRPSTSASGTSTLKAVTAPVIEEYDTLAEPTAVTWKETAAVPVA